MNHVVRRLKSEVRHRFAVARATADAGMSTAEYAVGTVAACGFAAVLWAVVHSGTVQQVLTDLVTKALNQL
jgi:hypothetical protein